MKSAYGSTAGDGRYRFWADMDADGDVDFWDYSFVKWNYTGPIGAGFVPEPAGACLLVLGSLGLLRRRRS